MPLPSRPVQLVWRKRTWRCEEPQCAIKAFTEQQDDLARPRGLLTTRACWWAIGQLRREHASIAGLGPRHHLAQGVALDRAMPEAMAAEEARFEA